ncbi:hypothetical protein JCM1393_27940 [Clostridium carnis]
MKLRSLIGLIFIISITIVQIFINNYNFNEATSEVISEVNVENTSCKLNISNIYEELGSLHNASIVSINNENDNWKINLNIKGSAKDIESNLNKISSFYINSYAISYVESTLNLDLEIISKK